MTFPLFISLVIPWVLLALPGVAVSLFVNGSGALWHVRSLLFSVATWILLSFVAALLGIPFVPVAISILGTALITTLFLWWKKGVTLSRSFISGGVLVLLLYGTFCALALVYHQGLPTGDSQKAMYWAASIATTHHLPDYSSAVAGLNRDPVDFYTPGLHTLIALITSIAPEPYRVVSFFSIATAIATAFLAVAITGALLPSHAKAWSLLTLVFVLTNFRFLRYLREPGYHLQNILGELLLFGLLFLGLELYQRWRTTDAILATWLALALVVTHQFSAFLAVFVLLPLLLGLAGQLVRHPRFRHYATGHGLAVLGIGVLGIGIAGWQLGLQHKIPHIFSTAGHLRSFILPAWQYPRLLGYLWFFLGISGLAVLIKHFDDTKSRSGQRLFVVSSFILLLLSQGPRLGIDIPPVRALLYMVIPLSIAATYFLFRAVHVIKYHYPLQAKYIHVALATIVIISCVTSSVAAFQLSHDVRTNSTLLPTHLALNTYLQAQPQSGAVLIDDYNRRSASWLLLSGKPMYTRIGADLATQMQEARQSKLRYQLYLNQLDYEKIFALASFPESTVLMAKHNIGWLTGITGRSALGFSYNPALVAQHTENDTTLYQAQPVPSTLSPELGRWLQKPTTLANDIGDYEDTFEYLLASVRTSRLSEPQVVDGVTYRETTAPRTALRFNVGDYITTLADQDKNNELDGSAEVFLQLTQPVAGLSLKTTHGQEIPLTASTRLLTRMSATDLPIESDGFITLYLENPNQHVIAIDLIALGLSSTP